MAITKQDLLHFLFTISHAGFILAVSVFGVGLYQYLQSECDLLTPAVADAISTFAVICAFTPSCTSSSYHHVAAEMQSLYDRECHDPLVAFKVGAITTLVSANIFFCIQILLHTDPSLQWTR
jgi:hypothetical protein